MAVYLGNQMVGFDVMHVLQEGENENVVIPSANDIVLNNEEFRKLQDAVGYRVGEYTNRTVPSMIEKLKSSYFINRDQDMFVNYQDNPWVRPNGWPDLDSLNLEMSGDDFIYMTYDNTGGRAAIGWHIEKVTNGKDIEVTIGSISNGVYTPSETIVGSSNNYVRWLTDQDDNYPVVRITGDIALCYSYNITLNGVTQYYRRQPVVERIAYVPHLTKFCTSYSTNAWGLFTLQREKVNNGDGNALTNMYYAWAYCRSLQDLDITGLKTQNVTSMESTFRQLYKINSLDLRHFSVNKVTNLQSCFSESRALREVNLTGWTTTALTNLNSTFSTCISLSTILGIENFNTSNVTTFSSLFNNCQSIRYLNLTSWNTSKNTTLYALFQNCRSLIEIDLSHWDMSKVTSCYCTFYGCYSLKRINLEGCHTGIITNFGSTFCNCWSLSSIDLTPFQITSACTTIYCAFEYCYSLKELNFPSWDLTGISSSNNCCRNVFDGCWSLEKITGIKDWNFKFTNSLGAMFQNCYSLKEVDVSGWKVNTITSLAGTFTNCISLKTIDVSKWNPENCTTFSAMFSSCFSLTSVGDISKWDTSKVTTMATMFRYCYSLQIFPPIQNWDYSLVTTMEYMFSECYALKSVTWTNISLPVCTSIVSVFRYCYNLEYANLSGWSTPAVTNSTSYYHTLGNCHVLKDVIGFPIPASYTNIGFQDCENLSYNSLMTIVNALPQVTGTHTLRIPAMSLNLLDATEKAIATNKGWTLANS